MAGKGFFTGHAKSSAALVSLIIHAVLVVIAFTFVAVTVITKDATTADILTKALFLNDLGWSIKFLKQQKLKAVLVKADGAIYTTPGLKLEK